MVAAAFSGRLRIAALCGLATLAACSSGTERADMTPVAPAASTPEFCPKITLREGTAILRKGEGPALEYVASVAETSRSCTLVNGEIVMDIGISGRLVPAAGARGGPTTLPLRVAVVRGSEVLYSKLGQQSISTDPATGPKSFTYVDRGIRIPQDVARSVVIYAGFDEKR